MNRFFFNDASLHGQFYTRGDALQALGAVFRLRALLRRTGYALEVSRRTADRPIVGNATLRAVISSDPDRDRQRAVMNWVDRDGPHWDAAPKHDAGEYFEVDGLIVTETALAEVAMFIHSSETAAVVGVYPSRYTDDPLLVYWRACQGCDVCAEVRNFYVESLLEVYLHSIAEPPKSWGELIARLESSCPSLLLSPEIIRQLPTTFYPNVAARALILFGALDEINQAIIRNDIAKRDDLIGKWMTGGNSRITNASASEINDFGAAMTFKHPETDALVPCYWHAKIQTPQYRIHFEWPKREAAGRLFVGYFGEKLTKR